MSADVPEDLVLTTSDVDLYYEIGREAWKNTNAECKLPGRAMAMTHREFMAVVHMKAALAVLYRKGLIVNLDVRVYEPDPEPDTEGV